MKMSGVWRMSIGKFTLRGSTEIDGHQYVSVFFLYYAGNLEVLKLPIEA